jgi:ribosomal protein S18 acetylase RimI-like enzyme
VSPFEHRDLREEDPEAIRDLLARTGLFTAAEIDCAVDLARIGLTAPDHGGYEFLVASSDGRLVGYSCYGETPLTEGTWDLYWIAVDPREQGRGVGTRLLVETEERVRARGGRILLVETSGLPKYEATREFYRTRKYEEAARLRDHYRPGDDKVIFRKDLRTAVPGPIAAHRGGGTD